MSSFSSSSLRKIVIVIVIQLLQAFTLIKAPNPISHFTIQGSVFCDVCCIGAFSRHSYFLPGVNVHIECKLKASSGENSEQIAFSVNRTTNKHGVYRVDIKTALEGIESPSESIQTFCKASLTNSSSSKCNVLGLKASSTTTQLTLKSKQNNLCIYSLSPLSYSPLKKNASLCDNKPNSFDSSKFFLPNCPPFGFVFTWPPLPQLPPLPSLPPWPPFLPFPFYFPSPLTPSLPPSTFPTPSFPPMPFLQFPPPNPPSPRVSFDPRDPSTWIPYFPPQQPGYNIGNDPRTWLPPYYYPPSPPQNP